MSKKYLIAFEPVECDASWVVTNSNPRLWKQDGVRSKFNAVFAPSFPEIEEAYAAAGKGIFREGELTFVEQPEQEYDGDVSDADLNSPLSEDDFASADVTDINDTSPVSEAKAPAVESEEEVVYGDDNAWRDMSWPKMRSLATQFTDEPIKSKEQAQEVLEQAEADGKI